MIPKPLLFILFFASTAFCSTFSLSPENTTLLCSAIVAKGLTSYKQATTKKFSTAAKKAGISGAGTLAFILLRAAANKAEPKGLFTKKTTQKQRVLYALRGLGWASYVCAQNSWNPWTSAKTAWKTGLWKSFKTFLTTRPTRKEVGVFATNSLAPLVTGKIAKWYWAEAKPQAQPQISTPAPRAITSRKQPSPPQTPQRIAKKPDMYASPGYDITPARSPAPKCAEKISHARMYDDLASPSTTPARPLSIQGSPPRSAGHAVNLGMSTSPSSQDSLNPLDTGMRQDSPPLPPTPTEVINVDAALKDPFEPTLLQLPPPLSAVARRISGTAKPFAKSPTSVSELLAAPGAPEKLPNPEEQALLLTTGDTIPSVAMQGRMAVEACHVQGPLPKKSIVHPTTTVVELPKTSPAQTIPITRAEDAVTGRTAVKPRSKAVIKQRPKAPFGSGGSRGLGSTPPKKNPKEQARTRKSNKTQTSS